MDTMGSVLMDGIRYYRIRQFGYDYLIPWDDLENIPSYEQCYKSISEYNRFGDTNFSGVKCFKV